MFGGEAASGFTAFIPLILIFVVFYFLLIRPQQKKMKTHRAMLDAVRRGDRIVTNGGIVGLVTRVINRASDNVMRCFEVLTGSPLTHDELQADKPSLYNRECPTIHPKHPANQENS